jgi:hypothetical protein
VKIEQRDWGAIAVLACLGVAGFWMWSGTKPLPLSPNTLSAASTTPARVPAIASNAAPLPEPPTIVHTSAATLVDDELYSCVDLSVQEPPEVAEAFRKFADASPQAIFDDEVSTWAVGGKSIVRDALDAKHKGSGLDTRPKGKAQVLTKPCREQFSRTAIASCLLNFDGLLGPKVPAIKMSLSTAYYLIPDDLVMSRCIAAGGDWQELARDSSAYLYQKSQESARRLRKMVGQ